MSIGLVTVRKFFYFSRLQDETHRTYRLNVFTETLTEIGKGLDIDCISLSPDGEKYVFSRGRPDSLSNPDEPKADIFVSDVDFNDIVQLTDTPLVNEYHPIWSPNGELIAFGMDDLSDEGQIISKLMVVNPLDGTSYEIATSNRGSFVSFNWLDDGRLTYISFESNYIHETRRIYLVDVMTGVQSIIDLPSYTAMLYFDWSPPLDTILPTPTPTIPGPNLNLPLAPDCPNALPSRLGMFMVAGVPYPAEGEVRTTLRVREIPSGAQVGSLNPGQRFRIMEQAVCGENGLRWWPIEALDGSLAGWSAESINDTYLMEPIATQ